MNVITLNLSFPLTAEQRDLLATLLDAGVAAAAPTADAPAKRGRKPKEEAAAAPAAPAEPQMSTEDFQAVLSTAVKKLDGTTVKAIFAKFGGAKKFSDLKPADYAKVAADLNAALAAKTASADTIDLTS